MRRLFQSLLLLVLIAALISPAYAEGEGEHQTWTEDAPTRTITTEETQAIIEIPAERIRVLWSVEYSTESYPVLVTLRAHGTDGLPVYAFEFVDGAWQLLGTGTGPELQVPVEAGGPISLAVAVPENGTEPESAAKPEALAYPAEETAARPQTGGNIWLFTTLLITVAAIGGALLLTKRREH